MQKMMHRSKTSPALLQQTISRTPVTKYLPHSRTKQLPHPRLSSPQQNKTSITPDGRPSTATSPPPAKGNGWLDRLQTKPLPTRDAWLSFFLQLYPEMIWGLSTVIMPTNKLEQEFQRLYYKCLLKLGVNHCTIARE